jgi:hypothetical protein
MKTLERFWQWHDAEKPDQKTWDRMRISNLSENAYDAIDMAWQQIAQHIGCGIGGGAYPAMTAHFAALRDLSLSLCAALERMREQVPVPVVPYAGNAGVERINERLAQWDKPRVGVFDASQFHTKLQCDKLRGRQYSKVTVNNVDRESDVDSYLVHQVVYPMAAEGGVAVIINYLGGCQLGFDLARPELGIPNDPAGG